MVTLAERVAARYAVQVEARGTAPLAQARWLKRVLSDLDRSKFISDFDTMQSIFASLRGPRGMFLPVEQQDEARRLAGRMDAISDYLRTFVVDALAEAGEFLEALENPEELGEVA